MSGFARDEALGRTTPELKLWFDDGERSRMVAALRDHGTVRSEEVRLRRKSGELITALLTASLFRLDDEMCVLSAIRDITARRALENERELLIEKLQHTLATVKALSGIIPICMYCKKIRDDQGYWNLLERFVSEHSSAEFSHGICPDCFQQYYPEEDLAAEDVAAESSETSVSGAAPPASDTTT